MTWTVRTGDGERPGVTLHQLESLVLTGKLRGEDLLRSERDGVGSWQKVEDVPHLRRQLQQVVVPVGTATGMRVAIGVGEDGKVRPLSDEMIAQLLSAAHDEPSLRAQRLAGKVLWGVAFAIFAAEAYVLLRAIAGG